MSQIGRYEIVRQTGNHGLGSLYQAFDPVMHRPVMIRIADRNTNPGVSFDQARQAIFFDAKQLANLDHPNIIKFLACEEDDVALCHLDIADVASGADHEAQV